MGTEEHANIRFISGDFTTISNKPLQDERLSLEARGLIASVLSLPRDWSFNRVWAQRKFKVGRDKLDRILGELKAAGYMRFIQPRLEGGKLGKGTYWISADPRAFDDLEPLPDFQGSGDHRDTCLPEPAEPASGESGSIQKKTTTKETDTQSAQARGASRDGNLDEEETRRRRIGLYRKNVMWPTSWGAVPTKQELIDFEKEMKDGRDNERRQGTGRHAGPRRHPRSGRVGEVRREALSGATHRPSNARQH